MYDKWLEEYEKKEKEADQKEFDRRISEAQESNYIRKKFINFDPTIDDFLEKNMIDIKNLGWERFLKFQSATTYPAGKSNGMLIVIRKF